MSKKVVVINDSEKMMSVPYRTDLKEGKEPPESIFFDFMPGENTLSLDVWNEIKDYHSKSIRNTGKPGAKRKRKVVGIDVEEQFGLTCLNVDTTSDGLVDIAAMHHSTVKKLIDNCFDVEKLQAFLKQEEGRSKPRNVVIGALEEAITKNSAADKALADVQSGKEQGKPLGEVLS